MKAGASNNKPTSEPMSASKPTASSSKAPALTESGALEKEAKDAKAALAGAISELKAHLGQAADPKTWTRDHPWGALGVAVAAGLVTGLAAIPTKRGPAEKRIAELEDRLEDIAQGVEKGVAPKKRKAPGPEAPAKPGLFNTLLHEVFSIAKPAITSAITAAIASKNTAESVEKAHGESDGAQPAPAGPATASA